MAFTLYLLSLLAVSSLAQFEDFNRRFGDDDDSHFDFDDGHAGFHPGNRGFSHAGHNGGPYGPQQPQRPKRKYLTCRMYNEDGDKVELTISEKQETSHDPHGNSFGSHFGGSHHGLFNGLSGLSGLHGFPGFAGGSNLFGKEPHKGGKLHIKGKFTAGSGGNGVKGKLSIAFVQYGNTEYECQGVGSVLKKKSKSNLSPFSPLGGSSPFHGIGSSFANFGSHFNQFGPGSHLGHFGPGHHSQIGFNGLGSKKGSEKMILDQEVHTGYNVAAINAYIDGKIEDLAGHGCMMCHKTPYGDCVPTDLCGPVVFDGYSTEDFEYYIQHKKIVQKVQHEAALAKAASVGGGSFPGQFPPNTGIGGGSSRVGGSSSPSLF